MRGITFDIAHMLAGTLVLVSFMQLYQDRLYALLNIFALHALILALSVGPRSVQRRNFDPTRSASCFRHQAYCRLSRCSRMLNFPGYCRNGMKRRLGLPH